METISGVPVTEEQIQAWADEAERGYDVEQLRRRGRRPIGDGLGRAVLGSAAEGRDTAVSR